MVCSCAVEGEERDGIRSRDCESNVRHLGICSYQEEKKTFLSPCDPPFDTL